MNAQKQGVSACGPEHRGGTSGTAVAAVTLTALARSGGLSPLGAGRCARGDGNEKAIGEGLSPLHGSWREVDGGG